MVIQFLYDIAVSGVNHSLAGNGGIDCLNYIPYWQRFLETVLFVWLSYFGIQKSAKYLHDATKNFNNPNRKYYNKPLVTNNMSKLQIWIIRTSLELKKPNSQKILFYIYLSVFIIELFYKFVTRTAIFLLNPCHVSTILQLIILKPTALFNESVSMFIFQFQLYTVPGAIVALVFPILNTRELPGEVLVYYVQHILILIVPIYLMFVKETFVPEDFFKMSWSIFSVSIVILYHFTVLQLISILTQANLNCTLCPAISDPFKGPLWRIFAVAHQSLTIPIITKLYGLISFRFVNFFNSLILKIQS